MAVVNPKSSAAGIEDFYIRCSKLSLPLIGKLKAPTIQRAAVRGELSRELNTLNLLEKSDTADGLL
jgi:hypothetical protein